MRFVLNHETKSKCSPGVCPDSESRCASKVHSGSLRGLLEFRACGEQWVCMQEAGFAVSGVVWAAKVISHTEMTSFKITVILSKPPADLAISTRESTFSWRVRSEDRTEAMEASSIISVSPSEQRRKMSAG